MSNYQFMSSLFTFYLKGSIDVDDNGVKFMIPNTILEFIPLGKTTKNMPISQISSVDSSFSLNMKTFGIGLLLALIGLMSFGDSIIFALIMLLIGINFVISAFQTILTINCTGSEALVISALVFDKKNLEAACEHINLSLRGRVTDTNVRVHTEASTDRIVDAIAQK